MREIKDKIKAAYDKWMASFGGQGVQFVVGDKDVPYIRQPGVLYVSGDEPSNQDRARLERIERRANELLKMGVDNLNENPPERAELLSYLHFIWTPMITRLMEESAKPRASDESEAQFQERCNENDFDFSAATFMLLQPFVDAGILHLRYKRAGEILPRMPNLVRIPWQPLEPFSTRS